MVYPDVMGVELAMCWQPLPEPMGVKNELSLLQLSCLPQGSSSVFSGFPPRV